MDGADVEDRESTYLYKEGDDSFVFMDKQSYDQVSVPSSTVGDDWQFMKENTDVSLTFYNGRVISVTLPNFVQLRVTHSEPGVKGDTANNVTKPATLETGATIAVPIFINEGDLLKIDTREGIYLERMRVISDVCFAARSSHRGVRALAACGYGDSMWRLTVACDVSSLCAGTSSRCMPIRSL